MPDADLSEVDANYEAFLQRLPELLGLHRNKYALIHNREIIGFYSTLEDAYTTAERFLSNEPFSVQRVTDIPVDLGFFSHAADFR